ncbi:MAG: SusC/RagA family TonB-linked outer membrane protein [Reichenbachiella sp.]
MKSIKKLFIICSLLASTGAIAQDVTVTGKVTDASDGSSIPGVTIVDLSTGKGAVSDIEGNYSMVASSDSELTFSFIGYATQKINVANRSVIDVQLELDIQELSEVVVIGYGAVKKTDLTGVVAVVEEEQFNKGIIGSPDKLLVGKVAGLQINTSGDPGSDTEIRLRGSSINGQDPLFVIDGIPLSKEDGTVGGRNPLNFMNPNDVESVTVLKDASAAAIYGSRGANGVIIITTKNGEAGKMKISYDGFYSLSVFTQKVGLLSPENFRLAIFDKAPGEIDDLGDYNTDWVDEVLQTAHGMQHNVAVSGGGKTNNYFASVNYLDNKGVMRNTSNKSTSISLKYNQKLFNNTLDVRITSKTGFVKDQFSPNVIGDAMRFDPTRPVNDTTAMFGGYYQWNNSLAVGNPVANQDLNNQEGETIRTLNSLELEYKLPFLDGLTFKTIGGYNYTRGQYYSVASEFNKTQVQNNSGIGINDEEETKKTKLLEAYFNYKTEIGDKNNIDLTAGYSWQNFRQDQHKLAGNEAMLENDEYVINDTTRNDFNPLEDRLISFFGRANIDIKGKYLITASLRRDGSTKFGESNKWGLFPAAAFAWRVIEEDFASNWEIFSDFKLRVGYGVTGNQDIDSYKYNTFYRYSDDFAQYQFGNQFYNTLRPGGVDPNLKWEETVSTNFGVDVGLFDGKLNMSLEYYIKNVNDLLYEVAVPAGTNLSDRVLTNIGEVQNKGWEFNLGAVVVDNENFQWDLSFNLATNQNEVIKLDNSSFDPTFGGYSRGDISGDVGQRIQVLKVGEPIDAFRTYVHKKDETGSPVVGTDLEMYEDQLTVDTDGDGVFDSGDGVINEDDLVVGESPTPSLLLGLTSIMKYKSWDLTFTVRSSHGNYVYNNVASSMGYFDLLTENNVTNNIHESAYESGYRTRQLHSDYYVENASFVKLDNITLGYTFEQLSFARIKAYVTAQNVLTISPYSGVEPEIFNGIDNNLYPRSSTFIIGLNANF